MDFIFEAITGGLPAFSNGGNMHTCTGKASIDWDNANIVTFKSDSLNGEVIYKLNVTQHDIKINGTTYNHPSGITGSALFNLLRTVFPKANSVIGTGGSTVSSDSIATKTDDIAAFAALTNGQGADFEVAGIIYRYSKNATGVQFKNYNQYP